MRTKNFFRTFYLLEKLTRFVSGRRIGFVLWVSSLTICLTGCGPRPVPGGTTGTLRAGGELLGEIQVNVHRLEGSSPQLIGFGVTSEAGAFQLVQPGATGNLWLKPGEYRFTVESVGAPYTFPEEYTKPETTPLQATWTSSDKALLLEVPAQLVP